MTYIDQALEAGFSHIDTAASEFDLPFARSSRLDGILPVLTVIVARPLQFALFIPFNSATRRPSSTPTNERISVYKNEDSVGTAIRESGLQRSDLYITTKFDGGIIRDALLSSLSKVRFLAFDISTNRPS